MNRNDYLMHYGVKGMKWGMRHEPERVGGVSRYRTDVGKSSSDSHRGLSDRQKTALKVAAGAALVVGGTVLAHKMNKRFVANGDRAIKRLAKKQSMNLAVSDMRLYDHSRQYVSYAKASRSKIGSGTHIVSTKGHLSGNSRMHDRYGAAKHRADFYDKARKTYAKRFETSAKESGGIKDVFYTYNKNVLDSEYVNALDQMKYTKPARISGSLPKKLRRP